MTGSGGVVIKLLDYKTTFKRDFKKLTTAQQNLVEEKLNDLLNDPMPNSLKFEKLNGYRNPNIYSIHITGNYKASFEIINGSCAYLRRVGTHNLIDRSP